MTTKRVLAGRGVWLACGVLSFIVVGLLWACRPNEAGRASAAVAAKAGAGQPGGGAAKQLQVDLDKAVEVKLPEAAAVLKPAPFRTADGPSSEVFVCQRSAPVAASKA